MSLSFFYSSLFLWRPVGVSNAKIRCPNTNCSAPPESFLIKSGFRVSARQVCSMTTYYTLLTERLKCPYCEKERLKEQPEESEDAASQQQQYIWLASSPKILMSLAQAIRNIFPAILCGKRAVDKSIVTLLGDRFNAISVAKVQRLIKQGHDEWYADRRGLYQTLLYSAHTAKGDQSSILAFAKKKGSYTPPLPQAPLPSVRVLRCAHLISEMEKTDSYRASILSVTGKILCIGGTRQVCASLYSFV